MPRLFIALDIPDALKAQLLELQSAMPPQCRPVPAANMHLTLVFIGPAELAPVRQTLNRVRHPDLSLTSDKLGCFAQGRSTVFWAGVRHNTGLLSLRQQLLEALQRAGQAPDTQTFRPHITLARSKSRISTESRERFLSQQLPRPPTTFGIDHFSLYSSETLPQGPVYRVEARYSLV